MVPELLRQQKNKNKGLHRVKLYLSDLSYRYEMENLCRLFFSNESIQTQCGEIQTVPQGRWAEVALRQNGSLAAARAGDGEREFPGELLVEPGAEEKEIERCLAVALYRALCSLTGNTPQWGVLTGVRPVKLFQTLSSGYEARHPGRGNALAAAEMREKLLVSPDKIELCRRCAEVEQQCVEKVSPRDFSLYIAIPFCPTRCAYCSFVSHSIERAGKLAPDYLNALEQELEAIASLAEELGLRLKSVYIGGGTPTTLSAAQLERLMNTLRRYFPLPPAAEFTVEAGRPDTLEREKLAALRAGGVTRLAVNPQTLDHRVLEAIGRRHTAQQTLDAFALARECGFDNINMDLIAGLPLDTPEGFERTLDGVLALRPEGITVHTLSMKRSARMTASPDSLAGGERLPEMDGSRQSAFAARMLDTALRRLTGGGYIPYYLYRQSKMLGNLENVGWSLPGREGLYNIYMMNELHTVLAAGAGAVTRLKDPRTGDIERVFNFKYPYEYISRFDQMLERKQAIAAFYTRHPF